MDEACSHCGLRQDCQSVYKALGKVQGPSVFWKSIWIFLVPLFVFAAATAGLDGWLKGRIEDSLLRITVVFLLSAVLGGLTAAAVRLVVPGWTHREGSGRKTKDVSQGKKNI